ncbi:elongation factor-1 alpha, partial [bacterium]|nr:elongation factor-1 alpha [bacterium]
MKNTKQNLTSLPFSVKTLFTGYLATVGLGLLMAGVQILLSHGMADGKFGLSVDDIVYSYYGNRDDSRLETKLNGTMKDKASIAVRTSMIRWAREGSPEDRWEAEMKPLFTKNCGQ